MGRGVAGGLSLLLSVGMLTITACSGPDETGTSLVLASARGELKLRPRYVPRKTGITVSSRTKQDQIVVKFAEGSHVRWRNGLRFDAALVDAQDNFRLSRQGLTVGAVNAAIRRVTAELAADPTIEVRRLFSRSEAELDADRASGEAAPGDEIGDPNLFYEIQVPASRAQALLNTLNASDVVEIAYPALISQPAAVDIAPTTPYWAMNQLYLNGGPTGIDAKFAWTRPGGTGTGVSVIDVEWEWNVKHEDLNALTHNINFDPDAPVQNQNDRDHGTASLGVMAAARNGYGATGAAYGASFGVSKQVTGAYADAIDAAAGVAQSGDVILLERHVQGPDSGQACTCWCNSHEYLPVEWGLAEYNAIKLATASGKVIIEPAGNGSMNLDSSLYDGKFQRSVNDSGAIMVGAGIGSTRQPECFTNYGSRVDVQSWGSGVTTLGYGHVRVNGADERQWYTPTFGGTSSASPIVAAAAADYQGWRKAQVPPLTPLNSTEMRFVLSIVGTPQPTPVQKNIGPQPNLRALIAPQQPPALGNLVAARQSTNVTVVFAVGSDGALYRRWVSGTGAWQGPVAMTAPGLIPPGAALSVAKPAANQLNVFYVGNDGKLYTQKSVNDGAWAAQPALTGAGFAPPGAPIATGLRATTQLGVFVVTTGGALGAVWSVSNGPWSTPQTLVSNFAPAGAGIASGRIGSNQLEVFAVGNDGAIKAAWATDSGGWNGPLNVSPLLFAPAGAPLATGNQNGTAQLDVLTVGFDGAVKGVWTNGPSWFGPLSLTPAGATAVGGKVSTAPQGTNTLHVFYASATAGEKTGMMKRLSVVGLGAWSGPTSVTEDDDFTLPGAATSAATVGSTDLGLFSIAHRGLALSQSSGGAWSLPVALP